MAAHSPYATALLMHLSFAQFRRILCVVVGVSALASAAPMYAQTAPPPELAAAQQAVSRADQADADLVMVGSLRRGEGGMRRMLASLAEAFVRGVDVDWTAVLPAGSARHQLDLPTYAFDPPRFYDIALRDFGLMFGALALARLAAGSRASAQR